MQPDATTISATCRTHGPYQATSLFCVGGKTMWSRCKACSDELRERQRQTAEREERSRRQGLLGEAGIAARFSDASFEPPPGLVTAHVAAIAKCKSYADAFSQSSAGLVLIGPTGTGKTHLASAIVKHVALERGLAAAIVTARALVRALRDCWRRGTTRTESEVVAYYGQISLLAIDDLGVGFGTDADITQLLDIVDRRYQSGLPTLVTTNATLSELQSIVGARICDRLLDGSQVIPCTWSNLRKLGRPSA